MVGNAELGPARAKAVAGDVADAADSCAFAKTSGAADAKAGTEQACLPAE